MHPESRQEHLETKFIGVDSPEFTDTVRALQTDVERTQFVRGLLKVGEGKTVQQSDVNTVLGRLSDAAKTDTLQGVRWESSTREQRDAYRALTKSWSDAVQNVLKDVTVESQNHGGWAPHPQGSNDYGSAD